MDSVRKSGNVLTNITSERQYIIRTYKMLVSTAGALVVLTV